MLRYKAYHTQIYICRNDFTSKCKTKHIANVKVQTEVCCKVQGTTLLASQETTELTKLETNKQHTCMAVLCVHSLQSGSMKCVITMMM